MAERRYTEGAGTQLEIGDALLALNRTRTNYVQAVYDHKIALAVKETANRLGLLAAAGTGKIPREEKLQHVVGAATSMRSVPSKANRCRVAATYL